ncbi:hypothetical protein JAAARDRAFT_162112 [Jaapia argillacea MUCL 33604]|uniref:HIT-type domain-containing protein n=1 Tax=Jaapia argillacea MUCL 33604 TaxID=933084 RepID=A0A067PEI8_9AGAM|nr:hypothetical protein JAAARDRAFT_162112 [Jaapia argillacea MUCL 33604]
MAPKRGRPSRQTKASTSQLAVDPEIVVKRTRRHLEELERSNYSEPSTAFTLAEDDGGEPSKSARGRARQTISDKRNYDSNGKKKKSTMNIRTALLYRKNLSTLIDESGIANLPSNAPSYLTAVTLPPREPPRLLCSVCGYWGRYKCKKCALPYCDLNCQSVHDETRCERRVV